MEELKPREVSGMDSQANSLDALENVKPVDAKPFIATRVKATITNVNWQKSKPEGIKVDKGGRRFTEYYFRVYYQLDKPFENLTELTQTYSFKMFETGGFSWGGKDSNTFELIKLMSEVFPDINVKDTGIKTVLEKLIGKKVYIISKNTSFGGETFIRYKIADFILE